MESHRRAGRNRVRKCGRRKDVEKHSTWQRAKRSLHCAPLADDMAAIAHSPAYSPTVLPPTSPNPGHNKSHALQSAINCGQRSKKSGPRS